MLRRLLVLAALATTAAAGLHAVPATARPLPTVALEDGLLTIAGTDAKNEITVSPDQQSDRVRISLTRLAGCDDPVQCDTPDDRCRSAGRLGSTCVERLIERLRVDLKGGSDPFSLGLGVPAAIDGGPGNDELLGGRGPDVIRGGPGIDPIDDQPGSIFSFVRDADRIFGGPGADEIASHGGRDVIDAGGGRDFISIARASSAKVKAGPGNDEVSNFSRRAVIDCGPGRDTVWANGAKRVRRCEVRR